MDNGIHWENAPRDTASASASPSATGSPDYTDDTSNVPINTGWAQDLFRDKFMNIATGGSNGEKVLRGFLIGVAIGLVIACFTCCWYPCCGGARGARMVGERRHPRWLRARRGPVEVDEGDAPETREAGENREGQENQETTENQDTAEPRRSDGIRPNDETAQTRGSQETPIPQRNQETDGTQERRPD